MLTLSSATASDLGTRIRRAIHGGAGPMGTLSRGIAAVLICGLGAITLPCAVDAQRTRDADETKECSGEDLVDWEVVKTTSPEGWSDALKGQIAAAGHDVEAIAERVRQGQTRQEDGPEDRGRDTAAVDGTVPDLADIERRIQAAIENGNLTPEEGRERLEAARRSAGDRGGDDRLQDPDAVDWPAVMAVDPEDWPDELEAQIVAAGYDLEEVRAGIKQRQEFAEIERRIQAAVESGDLTAVEGRERLEAAGSAVVVGDRGGEVRRKDPDADRSDRDDSIDWEVVKTTSPEDWSDALKGQIAAAGHDVEASLSLGST